VLFSAANAFLFRPVQAANPSELVQVFTSDADGAPYGGASYADYEDFRDRARVFSRLLASTRVRATLSDADRPELMHGLLVSGNYFDVLGLLPSRGRFFLPEENRTPATHPVVVLSHHAWLRRFNADPDIAGRVVRLNGQAFTVIGVGPHAFAGTGFDEPAEFFVPVMMHGTIAPERVVLHDRQARVFTILGRLAAGVPDRDADAALARLAADLLEQDPAAWQDRTGRGRRITVLPELDARHARSGPGPALWIMTTVVAGVAVLLGITGVNVATVLLARASARRKEIAIRLAMGASRGRVVRLLLTECALLAAAGGAIGLLIAQGTATLFSRFRPAEAPAFDLSLDYRILLFSIAASLAAVAFFGLAPVLQSTRPDLETELRGIPRTVRMRRFHVGLRDALVVVQVAVSLASIVFASLLYRSVLAGFAEDVGFRRDGLLSIEADLAAVPAAGEARERFYREAVDSLAALPGIDQVVLAALVPLDGSNRQTRIAIRDGDSLISVVPDINVVGAGYFALLDVPLLRGREFTAIDRAGAPRVAVVNESMAREFWNGDAVGRVFEDGEGAEVLVVGMVRDLRHRSLAEAPRPMVYFAAAQSTGSRMTFHLRTGVPAAAIGPAVQRTLRDLHASAGLSRVRTMAEYLHDVTAPQRLGGWTAAGAGMLELALAIIALYGVIAYATSQRTREIGLRMALGATAGSVHWLIMRKGLTLAAAGVVAGAGLALASGPALASLLIGVGPADPMSFAAAAALLLPIAAAASYVPARRALRIDPSAALRRE
jgi:predicted permease